MRFQNSIRIVDVDFYMASPLNGLDVMYSDFRGIFINQVPVIRVFGSTETGEKICTHVHGVFPYIYIPYSGENDINAQIYKIAIHIDKALNISMNQASSNNQHVYKISLVSAYPFYGYHAKQHQFLKIYLYNPSLIRKLSGLLQTDAILGKVYQPHESHLSFVLQFMIDYNLHGMSTMQVSDMKIRRPAGLVIEEDNDLYLPDNINRISTCELEADVLATNIINRLEIATGNLAVNPGIKALWEDEKQRRRNKNEESQIESCLTLKNMEAKPTNSQIVYKRLLLDRLAALSTDNADVKSKCLDTSVYPAETPSSLSVQNASFIENHSQSSNNSFSLDSSSLDTTLTPSNDLEMNNTLDGNFLDILEDLNENPENSLQEDSILSQVVDDNQEEDSMDLNWPMQPATPIKISVDEKEANESDDDMWNETLDTTLIPQLDGNDDVLDTSNENVKLEVLPKTFKINFSNSSIEEDPVSGSNKLATQSQPITKSGRDMPLLGNEQGIKNNVTAFAKFKTKVHLKSKLRLILSKCIKRNLDKKTIKIPLTRICVKKRKYIVKKSAKQILQVSEKQKEEVKIINALDNGVKPKFIIKSKFIYTLQEFRAKFKESSLFDVKIRYPNGETFLFSYNKVDLYPVVRKIRIIKKKKVANRKQSKSSNFNEQSKALNISENSPKNISDESMSKLIESANPQHICQAINFLKRKFENHMSELKKDFYEITCPAAGVNSKPEISSPKKIKLEPELASLNNNNYLEPSTSEIYYFPEPNNDQVVEIKTEPKKRGRKRKIKKVVQIKNENEKHVRRRRSKNKIRPVQEHTMVTRNKLKKATDKNATKTYKIFLDGNCDSSSSEEETITLKKRKLSQNSDSPRYSTLPVLISSSEKGATRESPFSKENNKTEPKLIKQIHSKESLLFDRVKRQLNFCDTTLVEEQILCNLKSSHIDVNNQTNFEPTSQTIIESSEFGSLETTSQVIESSESPLESSSSSENESPLNKSYFERNLKLLSKSEKYDAEAHFVPVEGSSKISSDCLQKSFNDSQKNVISSSNESSELCQPGQKEITNTLRNITSQSSEEDPFEAPDHNEMNNITIRILSQVSEKNMFPSNHSSEENKQSIESLNSELLLVDRILKPKRKAPTKSDVLLSLDFYKLPHVINPPPFFSNVEDVTGGIEVGLSLLKVLSKTTLHLLEFETTLDTFNTIRKMYMNSVAKNIKINRSNINQIILSCSKTREVILAPVRRPPLKDSVKNWLLFRTQKEKTPEKKFERTKIFIPQSPTGSDDDTDLSLTLTPCTPSSQTTHSRNSEPGTPKLSIERSSPSISNARSKKRILKSSQANTIKLGKSLLGSQEKSNNSCDLTGVSMNNTFGFNLSVKNLQNARALLEHHFLTVLIMEIHVRTRGDLKPNPEYDNTCAIFYSILNDFPENDKKALKSRGAIVLNTLPLKPESMMPLLDGIIDCDITYVNTETELIDRFLELIQYWDPDILAGYEIEMLSWGYLIDRASILGYNLIPLLGRIKESSDKYIRDGPQGELKITGRITLDVWRLMRHEISLQSYTFESIAYHILHKRVPSYTFKKLTFWWDHLSHLYRHRTVHHYLFRVDQILELFDKLDLVGRTSELARLFGIQFYEVLSRGSQFRVESMMLRLAKPLNFIPVSPSVQQRAKMKAPEYTPLVLEPESKLYVDPVVVLDFQSLYPSIMIAYNYCFSTCIGKVERLGKNTPFEFGATQLKISKKRVEKLVKADMINFSPCGVGFVKSKIREGIVPRMLKEILETRLMVKNSMKQNKEDAVLKRVLHNRQLGLKLIANVTYGYTSANFSGRMPAIEVGDSVVSKGRETLQRAIALVDNTPEWGAKVVYGDTDSLFILFPGRSKEWAFDVGKKIADVVTEDNPDPVKLKFEKVYQPCILQTKKRYVGYMYESPDQKEPIYEAKGIETVRRDGCPAVSKMLEKCLRLVFETKDVSIIKKYILRQFNKIIAGRISIQDFTFAKEYRGASSYRPGACVPSLELARKWKAEDKRSEPRRGERVPYVIVNGPPGLPIIKLVRSPRELLADPSLRPNALYYITRVIIPPINRCLTLIGADLHIWFNQMPRKHIQVLPTSSPGKKSTISQYFSTTSCASCGEQTKTGLCNDCCLNAQTTVVNLTQKIKKWEQNNYEVNLICQSCTKSVVDISCASLDCPIYYRRVQTGRDLQQSSFARQLLLSEF
ncbi:unnamed protein product [Brassicogethes aeneus]|uniref:DNA polymerase zeta catalytic subunit n=1 Tax=Brassicogethes aeneus TaxID=1431903 RepID=A0A9P0FF47_BRAAE|nr:unnamed protein product [Brassicogethes aeneus]